MGINFFPVNRTFDVVQTQAEIAFRIFENRELKKLVLRFDSTFDMN